MHLELEQIWQILLVLIVLLVIMVLLILLILLVMTPLPIYAYTCNLTEKYACIYIDVGTHVCEYVCVLICDAGA